MIEHCNNALRFLLKGEYESAFKEIAKAIIESGGNFHNDISDYVDFIMKDEVDKPTRIA